MNSQPTRYPHGVTIYAPRPEAARQQHRIVYRDRFGRRRNLWRTDARDAHDLAAEVVRQLDAVYVRVSDDPRNRYRPFSDLVGVYLERGADAWSIAHATNQKSICNRWLLPQLGDRACSSLTEADLREVVHAPRAAGRSDATGRLVYVTLRAIARLGVRRRFFVDDPMLGVEPPDKTRRRGRQGQAVFFVDEHRRPDTTAVEQLAEAFAAIDGTWWRALQVRVAAYTGLRLGELHELRTTDIDLDAGMIAVDRQVLYPDGRLHVHLPKCQKTRTTFLPAFLAGPMAHRIAEIEELASAPTKVCPSNCTDAAHTGRGALLFPSPRGMWARPKGFYKQFRDACGKAGWPHGHTADCQPTCEGCWQWSWHGLRHHFCTWALAAPGAPVASVPSGLGLEVADVSSFAGHASVAFTWQAYVSTRSGAVGRALAASAA